MYSHALVTQCHTHSLLYEYMYTYIEKKSKSSFHNKEKKETLPHIPPLSIELLGDVIHAQRVVVLHAVYERPLLSTFGAGLPVQLPSARAVPLDPELPLVKPPHLRVSASIHSHTTTRFSPLKLKARPREMRVISSVENGLKKTKNKTDELRRI